MSVLVLFFSFGFTFCKAQHPVHYNISDESGLPSNEVYSVLQDSMGFIWIGCETGLYRYDGLTYKEYKCSGQNGRAISFLQIDAKQRVWCKNFFGQIYRVDGDSLRVIRQFKTSDAYYPLISLDSDCGFWIDRGRSFIKYNENGDSIMTFTIPSMDTTAYRTFYAQNNLYVIGFDFMVWRYNTLTRQTTAIQNPVAATGVKGNTSVVTGSDGIYLLFELHEKTANRYVVYKMNGPSLKKVYEQSESESSDRIYSIQAISDQIWLTTSSGAYRVGEDIPEQNQSKLFPSERVSSMIRDREGIYWFTTLHNGLFVVPSMEVMEVTPNVIQPENNSISFLAAGFDNNVLCGSDLGTIYRLDTVSLICETVYSDHEEQLRYATKYIHATSNYTYLSRGRFSIIENATGREIIAPLSNCRDLALVGDTIYGVFPGRIMKRSRSQLMVGDMEGWVLYEFGGKAVEYDEQSDLLYYSLSTGVFTTNRGGLLSELKFAGNPINATCLKYSGGIMWIGTAETGVLGFVGGVLRYRFDVNNGLRENSVRTLDAKESELWIGTDSYVTRIFTTSGESSSFHNVSTFNVKEVNSILALGRSVYLGTHKGVVVFPRNMQRNCNVLPGISLLDVKVGHTSILHQNAPEVAYGDNNVVFQLSGIDFRSRGLFVYQYRLTENDTTWTEVSASSSQVILSQLNPGYYNFQVRVVNQAGCTSEVRSFRFTKMSPYWQRWWFYVVLVSGAAIVLTSAFLFRLNSVRSKAELNNHLAASQLAALKAQMNPHFMFNTLNSIQDLVIHRDIKSSNMYLSKFSRLMRKVLDASGDDMITLKEEIEILGLYLELEKLRFGDQLIYSLECEAVLYEKELYIPSMIIQPFVENAFKHGLLHKEGRKLISVKFRLEESRIVCEVIDNGVGRTRAAEIKQRSRDRHSSFATGATQKRIELLNTAGYDFKIEIIDLMEHNGPSGTKVVIDIPIRYS